MPRCYLAGWKTVTAPNQYDYLLGDVVPIGYGSNGSAELKNNFTLISLSIVTMAHLLSEEFWSHWLIMERFNAVWIVNRNTAAWGQTQSKSEAGCLWQLRGLFSCWIVKSVYCKFSSHKPDYCLYQFPKLKLRAVYWPHSGNTIRIMI